MSSATGHSAGRRRLIQGLSGLAVATLARWRDSLAAGREPRDSKTELRFFSAGEAEQLDALGDALVPGARSAGLSRYIDRQVSVPPAGSLLMLRSMDLAPTYGEFYRNSLRRLGVEHDPGEAIRRLAESEPVFYFAWRSDAIDVTDGTRSGFEELGVPYLGTSVFPTGGAVNPTFTLHATTLRAVTHLIGSDTARDPIPPREHGAH